MKGVLYQPSPGPPCLKSQYRGFNLPDILSLRWRHLPDMSSVIMTGDATLHGKSQLSVLVNGNVMKQVPILYS
jgi:hypothetical protein